MAQRSREQFVIEAKKHHNIGSCLAVLARTDRSFQKERLKEYGLGANEMAVLLQLHHCTTLSQDRVGLNLAMDRSTLSRIVKRMADRGFVDMGRNVDDARVCDLSLTREAKALVPALQESNRSWLTLLSQGFLGEEQEELAELLDHMLENSIYYAMPQKEERRAALFGGKRSRVMRNSWIDAAQAAARYRTLGSRLAVLNRIDRNFFKEQFAPYKLNANDMAVLLQLATFDELCQDDLAAVLAMDRTTLSKIVKALVARGIIYTARNAADGRMRYLGLTQKGNCLVPILRQGSTAWLTLLTEGLAEPERARILSLLGRMLTNVTRYALTAN